jgi:intracellular sulfur oxidation DsrE/DsrF family protein
MTGYLFIHSRDPSLASDGPGQLDLAAELAGQGHEVTVLLVHNAVMPARMGAKADGLAGLAASGVEVLADAFALAERGISPDRLAHGVRAVPLDVAVDRLAAGRRAIWQ